MNEAAASLAPGLSVRHGGSEPARPQESLADFLRINAVRFGERPALLTPGENGIETINYAQLLDLSENVARWLAARTKPGDRIAVWSVNALESVFLQHACALADLIIAHFNTGWTNAEVRHAAEKIQPTLAFAGKGFRGADLEARLSPLVSCPVLPLSKIGQIAREPQEGELPNPSASSPYLIQFTSGTTGKAKAALVSQACALYGGWIRPAVYGGNEHDLWLNPVPFHHIGGSIAVLLGALTTGSAMVVMDKYDLDQIVQLMGELHPTRMGGVPTMWHDILAHPGLPSDNAVRLVTLGGASVPPSLIRKVRDKTGATGAIGYGQSETGAVTNTSPDDPEEILCETIGRASPHMEVMIADPETGEPLPYGQTGEILARGPGNMIGYWGDEEATAQTIRPDGFLRTGDLATMDADGVIRFAGRLREVIIRGGENIYPAEVEEALFSHPDVGQAAVVKVPHERLGHEVGAVIKLKPGAIATPADLEAHAAQRVAHFKVPRHWRIVEDMPLTASGKIRKVELEGLFEPAS